MKDVSGADIYYRVTKTGKVVELASDSRTGNDMLAEDGIYAKEKHTYKINGKKVSKKKYDAYIKKLTKNEKMLELKYYKNTAKNRKLILKR